MKHLYFVRHGLSVMNKLGIFSGRTDTPLAPEGIEQSKLAGQEAQNLKIDVIVSSPLERAWETAVIIAKEIGYPEKDIVRNDLLTERAFGVLEGQPYTGARYINEHEGVESDQNIVARGKEALAYLQSLHRDNVLVVAHGSIGRSIEHAIDPAVHFDEVDSFPNAKIVQLL